MAKVNPAVDYGAEVRGLREVYTNNTPQARLNVICQRLRDHESAPTRLVTLVSAVEALARSLVVAHRAKSKEDRQGQYRKVRDRDAHCLIEDLFKERGMPPAQQHFPPDTWMLFRYAENFRNLIVHECTYLGQDKSPSLIQASEEVLHELVKIGLLTMK